MIYDITDPSAIGLAASVPIPPAYGIHDTYVRDGLAFVFAWNTGVIIYDVGNGIAGRLAAEPREVSRLLTAANGVPGGSAVHNGWWFHNPVTGRAAVPVHRAGGRRRHRLAVERRYPRGGRVESGGTGRGRLLPPRRRGHAQLLDGRAAADPLCRVLQRRGRRARRIGHARRATSPTVSSPRSAPVGRATPTPGASSSPVDRSTRSTC